MDLEPSQAVLARTQAVARGVTNMRLVFGDIRTLPFPDVVFDAVFGRTIMMSFRDPVPALREVHRLVNQGVSSGSVR